MKNNFLSWWIIQFLKKKKKMWENKETSKANKVRRNYLVSGPNCHTTKLFSENLLALEMKKHYYWWINLAS